MSEQDLHKLAAAIVDSVIDVLPTDDKNMLIDLIKPLLREHCCSLSMCALANVIVAEIIEAIDEREWMSQLRFELEVVDREPLIYRVVNVLEDLQYYFLET
jgi:hypothetical protein